MNFLKNFFMQDESGQGLVEYALLVGLIGLAVIGAVTFFGTDLIAMFEGASSELVKATPTATTTP